MHRTFTVEGQVRPWTRAGIRVRGGYATPYTQDGHREWAESVAAQVLQQGIVVGAAMDLPFALLVTTHPGTRKDGKPRKLRGDVDNLAKLVADALQGILYHDDRQAVLILGAEGEAVPGPGRQVIDIVWLPELQAVGIVSGALRALLRALTA